MARKVNFEKLKDDWYKKLKASGFADIEYKDGSIRSCRPRHARAKDPSLRQATEEYYYMAYHFLNEYTFGSEIDKVIWDYHSNGISARDIAKLLKDTRVGDIKKTTVWGVIKRLENIMKIKYLSP